LQCGAGPSGIAFKDDIDARLPHLTQTGNPNLDDLAGRQGARVPACGSRICWERRARSRRADPSPRLDVLPQ